MFGWMPCGKLCEYEQIVGWRRGVLALLGLGGDRMRGRVLIASGQPSTHLDHGETVYPSNGRASHRHTSDEPPRWTAGDGQRQGLPPDRKVLSVRVSDTDTGKPCVRPPEWWALK
jgi:hypothetical protein